MQPGVDLYHFGVARIWPSPISPSPLSTISANRAGTRRCAPPRDQDQPSGWNGLRLAEVRRSPPLAPHGYTFQPDIHRDFFPAFNRNHPQLKLPRLFESAVSPASTWAGPGWARSIHPHTHPRSRSSVERRFCTTIQAKPAAAATIRKHIRGCHLLATAWPDSFQREPCRLGKLNCISGFHYLFSSLPLGFAAMNRTW